MFSIKLFVATNDKYKINSQSVLLYKNHGSYDSISGFIIMRFGHTVAQLLPHFIFNGDDTNIDGQKCDESTTSARM